jgi:hypothetical protein
MKIDVGLLVQGKIRLKEIDVTDKDGENRRIFSRPYYYCHEEYWVRELPNLPGQDL